MIAIKNESELLCMRQACKITAAARALAGEMVRPGVSTKEIDNAVYDFIVSQGAKPSFLNYHGFPGSTCISVNSTVIHGIPGGYVLQDGDIIESRFAVERRNRTIHSRMREYLYELKHHKLLETSIIPLGDGVALSTKVREE